METFSISQLKELAGDTPLYAEIDLQLQSRSIKTTKTNKPYLEISFADSTGNFSLKIWEDRPLFSIAKDWPDQIIIRLSGKWLQNQYGLDGSDLSARILNKEEKENFLAGDETLRAKQEQDWQSIVELTNSVNDPRLSSLTKKFFERFEDNFRRTAAAKKNHHARRGGLVEHVAQMMRAADALCHVYPQWNRDLLIVGVLFHDCGKLWENSYPKDGFNQIHSIRGEMLGHIPMGIEVVNTLWRELLENTESHEWLTLDPNSEDVRLHLLHLIASHHGEYQFGSPTLPRSPEAFALHYIDNLDAKMEMIKDAYATSNETSLGIYEKMFPLPANLIRPLKPFTQITSENFEAEEHGDEIA
jgi:3'-5' exoribonuclease